MPVDKERLRRISAAMAGAGMDALICRLPENVVFLTGWWPLTGTSWVVFAADGKARIILPACEAREAEAFGVKDYWAYEWAHLAAEAPEVQIEEALKIICKSMAVDQGRIGVEQSYEAVAPALNVAEPAVPNANTFRLVGSALPKATLTDCTDLVNTLRVRKTPAEVEKLRRANEIASFGLAAFRDNVGPGITEIELASLVNSAVMVHGSAYKGVRSARGFAQVSSGLETARGWRPCEITTNRKVAAGDIVLLELGVVADGFWADNTRVVVVGEPTSKQKEVHAVVLEAQQAAIEKMKPGVKMKDVDRAARRIIEQAGYGDHFIHITGHGIGWRYHEFPPLLHPDNEEVLEEGMVSSVEPGVYMFDFGGMRIEDIVAVTADGADVLSTYERGLYTQWA